MSDKRKDAIVIIPYFGKWPSYFDLFLKSCSNNNWLQILFFTDCPIPQEYPNNITFISISFNELFDIMNQKLALPNFIPADSYKLCDLKPTYGYVFTDYVKGYNYWGYGDIDLFYGDLKSKIEHKIDAEFDIISARAEIVSGSFTLIKNNDYNNQLFKKLENFEQLVISEKYEGIDETSHNFLIWSGFKKLDLPKSCFTYLVAKEAADKRIRVSFETFITEYLPAYDTIKYENGRLIHEGNEIGYFHYIMNKRRSYFTYPKWSILPNVFYINNTGFYKNQFALRICTHPIIILYYLKKMPNHILKKIRFYLKIEKKIIDLVI